MTRENKELLLQDICARLPYKIRCSYYDNCLLAHCNGEIYGIENKEYAVVDGKCIAIGFIKPYLFHLSSMTEEQKEFLRQQNWCIAISTSGTIETTIEGFNWLNKNHFDYRGLIPMDLAIDATGLNLY